MEKRLVTRYATQSQEAADENQRRVEGVFEELEYRQARQRQLSRAAARR